MDVKEEREVPLNVLNDSDEVCNLTNEKVIALAKIVTSQE